MRGQAHTLEAFLAALLLVSSVMFALSATAVTPLSASTSNQHIQNNQRVMATDVLEVSAEDGSLREAVLYWNSSEEAFANASEDGYYTSGGPPNEFGRLLDSTFRDERIAFNVYVEYWEGGSFDRVTMVFMGSPSDNAVVASRSIAIYNDSGLSAPGEVQNVSSAWADDEFYAPDSSVEGELFNVLEVRIVSWRM